MASDRPNILMIFPDQWRGDCLEHLGHPVVETPFLTEIAGQGMTFTSAYSPCPSCIATRASLLTGMTPNKTGRLGYQDGVPWRYENTMLQCLRDSGYQTINVGKTHFYPQRAHLGYEINEMEDCIRIDPWFETEYLRWLREKTGGEIFDSCQDIGPNMVLAQPWVHPEHLHPSVWVSTRAIEMLERRDPSRPFYLALNYTRPHPPYDPPLSFFERFKDRELPPVPIGKWAEKFDMPVTNLHCYTGHVPEHIWDRARRAYFAQIAHLDLQIGRVLRWMQRFGNCSDNTMIVFMSDHGELLGDHYHYRKSTGHEGSAKVPLIMRLPLGMRDVPRNVRDDHVVSHEDIMPTLLEEAGVKVPAAVEGRSVSGFLRGRKDVAWRDFVHSEHSTLGPRSGWQLVTDGKEKLIWHTKSGEEWFFDLKNDPQELHDRVGDSAYAGRVELWRSRLVEVLAKRPEDGLVKDGRLSAGKDLPAVRPALLGK